MIALAWALPAFVLAVALAHPIRVLSGLIEWEPGGKVTVGGTGAVATLCAFGALAYWGGMVGLVTGGGGVTSVIEPPVDPFEYDPPSAPAINALIPLDTSNVKVNATSFSGDQDDTLDSIQVQLDTAGGGFGTPLIDAKTATATQRSDTLTDNANLSETAVYDVRWRDHGTNGGWSAWSATASYTNSLKPGQITDLSVTAASGTGLTFGWSTVHNGLGDVAFHNWRCKNITGDTASWSWGGTQEFEGQFFDSLGTSVGESVSREVVDLLADNKYECGITAYRGEPGVDAVYGPVPTSPTHTAVGTTQSVEDWTFVGQESGSVAISTSDTVTLPGPPAENDIVFIVAGSDAGPISTNGQGVGSGQGYTYVHDGDLSENTGQISLKVMGSTPDTDVILTASATKRLAYAIQVWRGGDPNNPQDVSAVLTENLSSGYPDPGEVTTITDNALAVAVGILDDIDEESAVGAPTGYTNLLAKDSDEATNPSTDGATVMLASKIVTPAGTENPGAFTSSNATSNDWEAATVVLRRESDDPVAPSTPTLSLSATSDTSDIQMTGSGFDGQNQQHDSTQWRLDNNSDMSSPFFDATAATNLTSRLVTDNANLDADATYYGDVRYFASSTGWTSRSAIKSVVNSAPSEGHPNEPSGMTVFRDRPFTTSPLPATGTERFSLVEWDGHKEEIVTSGYEGTPPVSPPSVIALEYTQGQEAGAGSVQQGIDGDSDFIADTLYLQFQIQVPDSAAIHYPAGSKLFYIKNAKPHSGSGDKVFALMRGGGEDMLGTPKLNLQVQDNEEACGAFQNYSANVGSGSIPRGVWVELEFIFIANTPGVCNGEMHAWINGNKSHAVTGLGFQKAGLGQGFRAINWDAIWGGLGDPVPWTFYIYYDHFYWSGK